MMRCGKVLGTLDYKTDKIYLMTSKKTSLSRELEEKIKSGKFIKN